MGGDQGADRVECGANGQSTVNRHGNADEQLNTEENDACLFKIGDTGKDTQNVVVGHR